jgi:hypothetical protein
MNGYRIAIVVALLLVTVQGLSAQDPAPVAAGARVRYTALDSAGHPAEGTVIRVERDTLFLAPSEFGRPSSAVPLELVSQLEVARVTGTRAGLYTALGAVGGALLGGVLGALAGDLSNATERECTGGFFSELRCTEKPVDKSEQSIAGGVVLGGLAGGLIGHLIGSQIETVQWQPVALEDMTLAFSADVRPGITIAGRIGH